MILSRAFPSISIPFLPSYSFYWWLRVRGCKIFIAPREDSIDDGQLVNVNYLGALNSPHHGHLSLGSTLLITSHQIRFEKINYSLTCVITGW